MKNRIKELRLEQGMSQSDLAAKAGLSTMTVYRLEKGQFGNLYAALAVCKALGKYLDEVFYYGEEERTA